MPQSTLQLPQPLPDANSISGFLNDIDPIYLQPWHCFSHPALRNECKTRGLRIDGIAIDLIDRLLVSDKNAYKHAHPLFSPTHNAAQQEHAFTVYEDFLAHQFEVLDYAREACGRDDPGRVRDIKMLVADNYERARALEELVSEQRQRQRQQQKRQQQKRKMKQRHPARLSQIEEALAEDGYSSDNSSGYVTILENLSPFEILLREAAPIQVEIVHVRVVKWRSSTARKVTIRGKQNDDEENATVIATVLAEYDEKGESENCGAIEKKQENGCNGKSLVAL